MTVQAYGPGVEITEIIAIWNGRLEVYPVSVKKDKFREL